MKNSFHAVVHLMAIIAAPFTFDIVLFIVLWLMASCVDCVAYILRNNLLFAGFYALHGFILIYIILLIANLLGKSRLKRVYCHFFLGLGVLNVITDTVCQYNFHTKFTIDMVEIIKATNTNETKEFLQTFMGWEICMICCIILGLIAIIYRRGKYIEIFVSHHTLFCSIFGISLLLVAVVSVSIKHSYNWGGVFVNKIGLFFENGNTIDLSKYRHNLILNYERDQLPQNIILVIGESHSKQHTSLYGYDKITYPLITQRADSNDVFVYTQVESPALHTLDAFKQIFNSNNTDKKWYECATVFDVAKAINMETYWISNQDKKGLYDNIVTSYAMLCDSVYFAGKKFMVAGRIQQAGHYDKNVIDLYNNIQFRAADRKRFFIFHLMGSHVSFKNRYPESFKFFTEDDYLDKKKSQRNVLAEYDNSVLYNDYIVNEIIKLFEFKEAIVFYFSDHSIDLYDGSDSYYGHARPNNLKSVEAGKAIPFWIYISPLYKKKHPEIVEKIQNERTDPFCTNRFYSKLLSLLNITVLSEY